MFPGSKRRRLRARMAVVGVLVTTPVSLAGYEIHKLSGVGPGTLYPILAELEAEGIVKSAWEAPNEDRPSRRLYWWRSDR